MSKRLQVLLDEADFADLRAAAKRRGVPVSVFVRDALRQAQRGEPRASLDDKLSALRRAATYSFPAPEIDQMLAETVSGYTKPLPE